MSSGPKGNVKEETVLKPDRKGLKTQHYGTGRQGSGQKVPHFKERETGEDDRRMLYISVPGRTGWEEERKEERRG